MTADFHVIHAGKGGRVAGIGGAGVGQNKAAGRFLERKAAVKLDKTEHIELEIATGLHHSFGGIYGKTTKQQCISKMTIRYTGSVGIEIQVRTPVEDGGRIGHAVIVLSLVDFHGDAGGTGRQAVHTHQPCITQ